jgi:hypothetical protein
MEIGGRVGIEGAGIVQEVAHELAVMERLRDVVVVVAAAAVVIVAVVVGVVVVVAAALHAVSAASQLEEAGG